MRAGQTALLLRSWRSWREAPEEDAIEASCSCPSPAPDQVKSSASLRSCALIRPSGTFSRVLEKGWRPDFPSMEEQEPPGAGFLLARPIQVAAPDQLSRPIPARTGFCDAGREIGRASCRERVCQYG